MGWSLMMDSSVAKTVRENALGGAPWLLLPDGKSVIAEMSGYKRAVTNT